MILTGPEITLEGVDTNTRETVVRVTSADAPMKDDGITRNTVDLVFPNPSALRQFARRLLSAAFNISQGNLDSTMEMEQKRGNQVHKAYYTNVLPDNADVITTEDFIAAVKQGAFHDTDGQGSPMRGKLIDSAYIILPSRLHTIPPDATHIAWFNK